MANDVVWLGYDLTVLKENLLLLVLLLWLRILVGDNRETRNAWTKLEALCGKRWSKLKHCSRLSDRLKRLLRYRRSLLGLWLLLR